MDHVVSALFILFILSTIYVNIYEPYFKVTKSTKLDIMRAYINLELNRRYRPRTRAFLKDFDCGT